jgi:hypothetical protein
VSREDESKRGTIAYPEKEIKSYIASALFLSKEGFEECIIVGTEKPPSTQTITKMACEVRSPEESGHNRSVVSRTARGEWRPHPKLVFERALGSRGPSPLLGHGSRFEGSYEPRRTKCRQKRKILDVIGFESVAHACGQNS